MQARQRFPAFLPRCPHPLPGKKNSPIRAGQRNAPMRRAPGKKLQDVEADIIMRRTLHHAAPNTH